MEEYERIIESLKKLLRDGNAFIPDFSVIFSTLSDIKQEYRKFKTENDSDDHAMEQACILVLRGDFIAIKCRVAFFSTVHKEIKPEKSKLPERVHPIVGEIEVYFAMMDEHLKKLNATVQQMSEKIKEIAMRGKLTGLEDFQLKLLIEELKCGTEKAENCLNQADKALESLQAELSSYLKKQGILTAASTLAFGGAAGAVAYGAFVANAAAKAAVAGTAIGGGWCAYQIWSLSCKYEENKKELNNLKSRLRICALAIKDSKADQDKNMRDYQNLKKLKEK